MLVNARRVAMIAGLLAGIYVMAIVAVRGAPDWAVAMVGGPTGIARHGGLVMRYRPPAQYDAGKLERSIAAHGRAARRIGDDFEIEMPGLSEPDAAAVREIWTYGGFELREVVEDMSLLQISRHVDSVRPDLPAGVRADIDYWRDDSGRKYTDSLLEADSPAALATAFDVVRAGGWRPPPHSVPAFERLIADDGRHQKWRSFLVGDEVVLDSDAVETATHSTDPNTGRPVVLIGFTPAGASRFAEITERATGHKLAFMDGGRVESAPVIMGPIRGGHAVITTGGGDITTQQHDEAALISALTTASPPPGGTVEQIHWVPPAQIATQLVAAVLILGLVGGGLLGLVIWWVVRFARPVWQPGPALRPGKLLRRRIIVTMLAPVALIALGQLPMPGVNDVELYHLMHRMRGQHLDTSVASLGVMPFLAAFVLIELSTLLTPDLRRARYQPARRIAIGRWVAIVGVVTAVAQSNAAARLLEQLGDAVVPVVDPGLATHLALTASLTVGPLLLVIVAGMIREHGLGNGYAVVVLSKWALDAIGDAIDRPTADLALGALTLVLIAIATFALLRMRVGDDEARLRVPSSGAVPLGMAGALTGVLQSITFLVPMAAVSFWLVAHVKTWPWLAVIAATVPAWSFVFSRRGAVATLAARAGLTAPSKASWWRATVLSLVLLLVIAAAGFAATLIAPDAGPLCDGLTPMLAAALLLDIHDDLRAKRGDMVAVWPLQHAQHAEVVRCMLASAGIDCHLASSHLRTLLAFFGPFAPIDVFVPAALADEARAKIAALYPDAPEPTVPTAVLRAPHPPAANQLDQRDDQAGNDQPREPVAEPKV